MPAPARSSVWSHNAVPRLEADPFGPFHFHEQDDGEAARPHRLNGAPPPGGTRRSYRWHLSCVGDSPLFVELVGGAAFPYAEQLLGAGEATPPRTSGGVHSTLPRRVRIVRPYLPHPMECHVDQSLDSRERLGVVGYIDDVVSTLAAALLRLSFCLLTRWPGRSLQLPGCGAFGVWAGSHHRVNGLLRTAEAAAAYPDRDDTRGVGPGSYTPMMVPELERIVADTPLTDCWGRAGDIVLFHSRVRAPCACPCPSPAPRLRWVMLLPDVDCGV